MQQNGAAQVAFLKSSHYEKLRITLKLYALSVMRQDNLSL